MATRRRLRYALSGFTLTEVLVVLAIIGALIALLIPAVMHALEAARQSNCKNNMRQIGMALHLHHESHGRFPPGIEWKSSSGMALSSWAVKLYPYLEEQPLYNRAVEEYKVSQNPFSPVPHAGLAHPVRVFSCPSDGRAESPQFSRNQLFVALTNYLGVQGTNVARKDGVLFADSHVSVRHIRDGTSNTIIVGERPASKDKWFGWLYAGLGIQEGTADVVLGVEEINNGYDILSQCSRSSGRYQGTSLDDPCHVLQFWSMHPAGAFFLYADGSVHQISYGQDRILQKAATRWDRPSSRS